MGQAGGEGSYYRAYYIGGLPLAGAGVGGRGMFLDGGFPRSLNPVLAERFLRQETPP